MNPTYNVSLFYKMVMNLMFWMSFGLIILFLNWFKVDFVPTGSTELPELYDLLKAKQTVLLIVTGFVLYGVLSFLTRHSSTEELIARKNYFLQLALEEWANIFINLGSIMAMVGYLIELYSYFIVTFVCYGIAFLIARRPSYKVINLKINTIQPSIDPTQIKVSFHKVINSDNGYVLEVNVPKSNSLGLHFNTSGNTWVRLNGCKQKLQGVALQEYIIQRVQQNN